MMGNETREKHKKKIGERYLNHQQNAKSSENLGADKITAARQKNQLSYIEKIMTKNNLHLSKKV